MPNSYKTTDLTLMIDSYFSGYNMDYDAECSFIDTDGIK